MEHTRQRELEQAEMQAVLCSGLLAKAPRLETFFRYICQRHLAGESEQIKEYSIATEALGRGADFDPKKDSIVRVEAHRLRKRLEEYYRGAGAGHRLRIFIPNGQYRPQFAAQETLAPETTQLVVEACQPLPKEARRAALWRSRPMRIWTGLLLVIGVAVLLGAVMHVPRLGDSAVAGAHSEERWAGPEDAFRNVDQVRLLTGYHGAPIVDRQGHRWLADAFFEGGRSRSLDRNHLANAPDDAQFLRAQRAGVFRYDIPLRQTTYELHLYMLEVEYGPGTPGGRGGPRTFRVSINGSAQKKDLDPLADTGGPNRLCERVFKDVSPGVDGKLHLKLEAGTGPAFLNAIELLPSPPGRIHPIRIVAQENPITDSEGRLWAADEYYSGGTAVCRRAMVESSGDALFQGERYGNFSYRIPVAPGKYRLTLHFAETWFGTAGAPAIDGRVFNVFVNGVALLRDYQVMKDAGGPNREVSKMFDNLEPNAQGLLLIEFVPVENYAEVNAIEVVATG